MPERIVVPFTKQSSIKADEAEPLTEGARDAVVMEGEVSEAFFFGAVYRHLVNVAGNTILVDRPRRLETQRVQLAIPREKILIYSET